ncbi:MAG TPA: Clp protease N-terminal domain-containing protein [Roseiflexaceae bacterium]|nr:Clp protease N-terminal domain-containing protein [Roseiflexaceae bacterium]
MEVERFTDEARAVFAGSRELMRARRHAALDVEHLLLALLRRPGGSAERLMRRLAVDVARLAGLVERELEQLPALEDGEELPEQVVTTGRVQRLLERAREQAAQLGADHIGTDHLLLAICGEQGGPGARALAALDVTEERVALALVDLRHPLAMAPAPASPPHAPSLEERVTALELALAELQLRRPAAPSRDVDAHAELEQARQRIALLERQNRYLEELLRITQDTLAYTRGLLDQAMRRGAP